MQKTIRLLGGLALIGALVSPAFAGESNSFAEGDVTIYTRSGAIIHKMISDPKMLAEITRDSMVIADMPIIVSHDGKMFLVKDRKMSDGKMLSDMMISK